MQLSSKSPIADNLKSHMQRQQLSARELARRSNLKSSFIYDILNGRSGNPSTLKLAQIAQSLHIPLSMLVSGDPIPSGTSLHIKSAAAFDGWLQPPALTITDAPACPVSFSKRWLSKRLGSNPDHIRWCHMTDDTMRTTIEPSDLLMVDCSHTSVHPSGLYLICEEDRTIVRRLEQLATSSQRYIRIIADNPCYASYEKPAHELNVLGRVVWMARTLAHTAWPHSS